MKEIGRNEAGEFRDFPILRIGRIEEDFQTERKESKRPRKIDDMKKEIHVGTRECFMMEQATLCRLVAAKSRSWWQPQKIHWR